MTPSSHATACSADSAGHDPSPRTCPWSDDGVARLVAAIAPLGWWGTPDMKEQRSGCTQPFRRGHRSCVRARSIRPPNPPSVDWAAMNEPERFRIREILRIPEIRAAMLGTFVIMLGYGILLPILPNYARSFGVDYDAVGVLIAAFSFTRLVFDPIVGRLIGRFGERSTATAGAVGVGVSTALAAVAPN